MKSVIYSSIVVILVILICFGMEICVQYFTNSIVTIKGQFFLFHDGSQYTYSIVPLKEKEGFLYKCVNESCSMKTSKNSQRPYYVIYDGGYQVINYENQSVKDITSIIKNYDYVFEIKEDYIILAKDFSVGVCSPGFYINTFDIYSFPAQKLVKIKDVENSFYSEIIQYDNFYLLDFLGVKMPNLIYDKSFTLLSEDYYVHGQDADGHLVLLDDSYYFFLGGVNRSGYLDQKQFSVMDSSGNITYSSPEFLSLQSFIYDSELPNEIVYVLAVDTDNILKLYDLAGNVIVSFEEWSDSKNVCIGDHPTYFEGSTLEIMIGNGNLNGKRYVYDFQTDELTVEELDSPVCTK